MAGSFQSFNRWFNDSVHCMPASIDHAVHPVGSSSLVRLLGTRPRLLAVGEPTHGAHGLLELRNDLFRELVEKEKYRTISIESDCLMGRLVDDYVVSGVGTLDHVLAHGFSHEWGTLDGNRQLVQWMREHNRRRPVSEAVRFAGFDAPLEMASAASPRHALTELHAYLARWVESDLIPVTGETLDRLLGPDERWTDPDAMHSPSRSFGRSAQAIELRLVADDLASLLDMQAPRLRAVTTHESWFDAHLCARTAAGLLRYHYWMADDSAARITRLCSLRDSMMAENLLALAERGPTLVSAHNSHLQRWKSSMQMWQGRIEWWSAGALVDARLGADFAFLPTAVGTIERHDVGPPLPNTVEGHLFSLRAGRSLVDTRVLAEALATECPDARVSPWFGYAPLDPDHLVDNDGLLFVDDADHSAEDGPAGSPA